MHHLIDFDNSNNKLQAAGRHDMPRPCHAAAQLQPIHALRLACGAQRALLPVAVGAMSLIFTMYATDVRRQRRDRRQTKSSINAPAYQGRGHNNTMFRIFIATLPSTAFSNPAIILCRISHPSFSNDAVRCCIVQPAFSFLTSSTSPRFSKL